MQTLRTLKPSGVIIVSESILALWFVELDRETGSNIIKIFVRGFVFAVLVFAHSATFSDDCAIQGAAESLMSSAGIRQALNDYATSRATGSLSSEQSSFLKVYLKSLTYKRKGARLYDGLPALEFPGGRKSLKIVFEEDGLLHAMKHFMAKEMSTASVFKFKGAVRDSENPFLRFAEFYKSLSSVIGNREALSKFRPAKAGPYWPFVIKVSENSRTGNYLINITPVFNFASVPGGKINYNILSGFNETGLLPMRIVAKKVGFGSSEHYRLVTAYPMVPR